MRIIAGKFKSRTLLAPHGEKTRPTTDRARESLFNVLQNSIDFDGVSVLDLFAGSGALGFEALSRGAAKVVFIEQDRNAQLIISKNAEVLGATDSIELLRGDVFKSFSRLHKSFDLILVDAPYEDLRARNELPSMIFDSDLLTLDGIAVVEHRSSDKIQLPKDAQLLRRLEAGEATFSIFAHKDLG